MWLILAFISAALLGMYEVFKKLALNNNAVLPILFLNTVFCSALFLPAVLLSRFNPELIEGSLFYVPRADFVTHLYVMLKAVIVLSSWTFAYFAMKHLPITIAGTIKASQPVLTLLGALLIFGERLNLYQWIGVIISIISFFMLSSSGKKEGIRFSHDKWIYYIVLATITGAISDSGQHDIVYRVGHYHGSHQCPVRQISHLGRIRPHGRTSVVYLLPDGHHVHHTSHLV